VQSPFKFVSPFSYVSPASNPSNASRAWDASFNAASQDTNQDVTASFAILAADQGACILSSGTMSYDVHIACDDNVAPSECPIDGPYQTISVTIFVAELDICKFVAESSQLQAALHSYATADLSVARRAFFHDKDIYLLTEVYSSDISINDCAVQSVVANDYSGIGGALAHTKTWSPNDLTESHPAYNAVVMGFDRQPGSCFSLVSVQLSSAAFPTPLDGSSSIDLVVNIQAILPGANNGKRSAANLNHIIGSNITVDLSDPAATGVDTKTHLTMDSSAGSVIPSVLLLVAGFAAILF